MKLALHDTKGLMETKRSIKLWQLLLIIGIFLTIGGMAGVAGIGDGIAVLLITYVLIAKKPKKDEMEKPKDETKMEG